MAKRSLILLVVVLLVAALLSQLLTEPEDEPRALETRRVAEEANDSREATELERPTAEVPPSIPAAPSEVPPELDETGIPERTDIGVRTDVASARPQETWMLEIEVYPEIGFGEEVSVNVVRHDPRHAQPSPEFFKHGFVQGDKLLVDLSEYYVEYKEPPVRFRVQIRRAGFVTSVSHIYASTLKWIPNLERGSQVQLARYHIGMEGSWTICGSAVTTTGRPVGNASVYLIELDEGGTSVESFDEVETSATGAFCLEVPQYGEWLAVSLLDDYRAVNVPLAALTSDDQIQLLFEPGDSLKVQVHFGEVPASSFGVQLVQERRMRTTEGRAYSRLGKTSVYWEGERVERMVLERQTDRKGVAVFGGLEPGAHSAYAGRARSWDNVGYGLDLIDGDKLRASVTIPVKAPLEFQLDASRIHVKVIGAVEGRKRVILFQNSRRETVADAGEDDTCTFFVAAGFAYGLRGFDRGCDSATALVEPQKVGATVQVELRCSDD